jgi:hypothetical protein
MKKIFTSKTKIMMLSMFLLSVVGASAQYNLEWAKEYVVNDAYHNFGDFTTDVDGNYYAWGFFQDSIRIDFNSTSGYDFGSSGQSVYIAKYNTEGELIWVKYLDVDGQSSYVNVGALKVDAQGNVYAFGRYAAVALGAQMDADPGSGEVLFPASPPPPNTDFSFLLKLDSNGNFVWVKEIRGSTASRYMDIDPQGNIYVAADYTNSVIIDVAQNATFSNPNKSFYLAKYTSDGDFVWAKQFAGSVPTSNTRRFTSLVVQNEHLYVSGWYRGNVDFDPGAAVDTVSSISDETSFIVKLDTDGTFVFTKRFFGDGNGNYLRDIAIDATGNIYAVGEFYGTVDFNPNSDVFNLTATGVENESDAFIVKLDNSGAFEWAKSVGGNYEDGANACLLDDAGRLVVVGFYESTADFDPGSGTDIQESAAFWDCFLLRFDAQGNYETSHVWGGDSWDSAYGILIDKDNNLLVQGTNGSTDMDYSDVERGGVISVVYLMKISADNSVSIDELMLDSSASIYPNPASNQFHIKDLTFGTSITITDVSGRVVFSGTANSDLMTISIQNWSNGLYLIQTELNGAVQQQKLMVSK